MASFGSAKGTLFQIELTRYRGLPSSLSRFHNDEIGSRGSAVTIESMATKKRHKGAPTGETGQEALYLKSLSDRQVQVAVKLRDGEVVSGWIEYFDDMMLRLTRESKPNLFIYKAQIRTITEGGAAGLRRGVSERGVSERGGSERSVTERSRGNREKKPAA
jgi:host factor-I protein